MNCHDGINQILVGINNNPKVVLNQFNENYKVSLMDKKTENK
jgi:hypothetical protein